jgi:uncharacterized membrane protein YgcG
MNEHYKAPEFALLALNGAAITALTAFWDALKDDDPANFGFAFILFALGAMTAVYAAYCRFVSADDGSAARSFDKKIERLDLERRGLSPSDLANLLDPDLPPEMLLGEYPRKVRERYRRETRRLWMVSGPALALGILILVWPLGAPSNSNWANTFRAGGILILLGLPPALAIRPFGRYVVSEMHRYSAIVSLALFSAGVLVAIGTLAQNQVTNLQGPPGKTTAKAEPNGGDDGGEKGGDSFEWGGGDSGGGGARGDYSVKINSVGGAMSPPGSGETSSGSKDVNIHVVCEAAPPKPGKKGSSPGRPTRTPRKPPFSQTCRPQSADTR